jgi:hypothetical protein
MVLTVGIVQEKMETTAPPAKKEPNFWASDASARRKASPADRRETSLRADTENVGASFPSVVSGESDVSRDYNRQSERKGYTRLKYLPTDDAYTNEHEDAFYGEARDGKDVGFVERNNTLDRL